MLKHTVLFVYILHIKWDSTLDFRGPGRNSQAEESLQGSARALLAYLLLLPSDTAGKGKPVIQVCEQIALSFFCEILRWKVLHEVQRLFLRVRLEALGICIEGRGGTRSAFLGGPLLDCPLAREWQATPCLLFNSMPVVPPFRLQGRAPEWLSNAADVGCFWTGDFLPLPTESSQPISVVLSVLLDSSSSAVWRTDLRSWE